MDTMDALRRPTEGQGVRTVAVNVDSQDGSGQRFPWRVPQTIAAIVVIAEDEAELTLREMAAS